jgi:protein-tyrosine phosphatase
MNTTDIHLDGAPNFRDVGGYKTRSGQRVRKGIVFRSSNLAKLTDDDLGIMRKLAVRAILDMRNPFELSTYPTRWPEELDTERIVLSINPVAPAGKPDYKQVLLDNPTPEGAISAIGVTYIALPDACGPALKLTADLIVAGKTPLVFHCSNGRDRTGLIAMAILDLLGVAHDDIRAHHAESNTRIDLEGAIKLSSVVFSNEWGADFDDDTLRTLNQALPQSVTVAFDAINETHGSTQGYFAAFGVDAAQQAALRNVLLEAA